MFADDTNIWTRTSAATDSVKLQNDLYSLTIWSSKWLLHFNPEKCKVMHVGHEYDTKYNMSDGTQWVELQPVKEEKDLGVTFTDNLRPHTQCLLSASNTRKITAMVRRNFRRLDCQDLLLVYKAYIRPHLECCIQSRSPYLRKDVQCLEGVQKAATKLVPALRKLDYGQSLHKLGLTMR